MKNRRWLLGIFILLGASFARADVRVGLYQKELPSEVKFSNPSGFVVLDGATQKKIRSYDSYSEITFFKIHGMVGGAGESEYASLVVVPVEPNSWFTLTTAGGDRECTGRFEIQARERELLVINIVPEKPYLYSVISHEMPARWPIEALKAQTVVARTFLYKNLGRHAKEGYDFCDLTHCQAYLGGRPEETAVSKALEETEGEAVLYHHSLASVYFHSTCGGRTASIQDVWQQSALPYLQSHEDASGARAFCRKSPYFEWNVELTDSELNSVLQEAVKGATEADRYSDLEVTKRDSSGRVSQLRMTTNGVQISISGEDFYRAWGRARGWYELKSSSFDIAHHGSSVSFTGRGMGHGIGFCQWGAKGCAESGYSYREILTHYFPGTTVGPRQDALTRLWQFVRARFEP